MLFGALLLGGCDGDPGPPGPVGPDGTPRSVKILLGATHAPATFEEMIYIALRDGTFPLGTEIDYVSLRDSVPSLATFARYDAVFVWSASEMVNPEATGDRLAEYVDLGGGLVIAQFAYSPAGPLAGRVMSPGYSPLKAGPIGRVINDKTLDPGSLSFPVHTIFTGIDVTNFHYPGQPDISNPELDNTAILIAKDTDGNNAVAINAAGNIIGANMIGAWWYHDEDFPYVQKFLANALLFVAGAY